MALPKKNLSTPPPVEEAGGVQQVEAPPAPELSKRLQSQNKAVERLLKHPGNEEFAGVFHPPKVRSNSENPAFYRDIEKGEGAGIAIRMSGALAGKSRRETPRALEFQDLYRAYKHTPHQPAAVFLKYLVHRIENIDDYDDPVKAVSSDFAFLKHHQQGKAAEKNGHLVPADLHGWMQKHPGMPEALLLHKAKMHAELNRGVGLNVRTIAGQPYVALTRGLNSDIMSSEHALSSWSDLVASGFGSHAHHAWVPLSSLWYSYQHGPEEAGGATGHENEYLVSPKGTKFEAQPEDVKRVRGHGRAPYYDNATDDELASFVTNERAEDGIGEKYAAEILNHSGAGPKTLEALMTKGSDMSSRVANLNEGHLLQTKFRTREQALATNLPSSIQNPNLTTEDLSQKVLATSAAGMLSDDIVRAALDHPKATVDTARTVVGQYIPGRNDGILNVLAKSTLSPPDVLEKAVSAFEGVPPGIGRNSGSTGRLGSLVLRNPNVTSEQADRIGRASLNVPSIDTNRFTSGPFSARFIQELSDEVDKGYSKEPLRIVENPFGDSKAESKYKSDLDNFLKAKAHFAGVYNVLASMGSNRNLDDDATEALIEAAQKHHIGGALQALGHRQNAASMSEISQLRVLRALDEAQSSTPRAGPILAGLLSQAKGLAPSTVWALALHHDPVPRDLLYRNKTVDPEVLAQAWPEDKGTPEEYLAHATETPGQWENDPYHDLARAIRDRRAYANRRATEHLIKPWPKGLAKSENDWWPMRIREWLSRREKNEQRQGYYYRAQNLDQARELIKDRFLPVEPTDEILEGQAVFAHPARDHYYHAWEKDPAAGGVLIYFETGAPPVHHDDRVLWPHDVAMSDAKIAGIRPTNLQKGERINSGPTFNGEKDYRPDESGDPKFPFQGGPKKEQSHKHDESMSLELPGKTLEPGENMTALAQLGHNDRFELVLAAACFLARKRYDAEKFRQGLAVYGDEARAALHSVDMSDSDKNLRALGAVIMLQGGKGEALSKSEPEPIGIHSVQPGNEDAVDAAEAVERAVRAGNVVRLKLKGKHSKGAMACRDPRTGKVYLLKPPGGKQSPAAGARDGNVSQPRREACFWNIADKVHLGGVIPHASLIIVNAQEWSAISLLGSDWRSLDERNHEKQYKGREVLGLYQGNGQLHRWAILDWVLGNSDSHGQNLLVNNGGSVAIIDHGAAFCGPGFDPAHDTKSFIPFYLRVWAPETDFKKMGPDERMKHMPVLGRYEDDVLQKWLVEDFTPEMTEREMRKYGVDDIVVRAVLERLRDLRSAPGNLSRTVNALWSGASIPKPDETV